jgi:TPR repeat protein
MRSFSILLVGAFLFSTLAFPQSKFANETYATLHARAEAGDAQAENELGVRFRMGDGVDKDLLTALGWYRLAAKQGLAIAYFNLGAAYYNGDGIAPDEQAACKWFLLASEAGDASGKEAYVREQEDPKTDHGTVCMVLAGDAYLKGIEIPKDEQRALKLYNDAAAAKNSLADVRLFLAYRDGLGVAKDPANAVHWLQLAADRHDGYALYLLGEAYESGQGVPADPHRACEEYKRSAVQGNHDAFHALGLLLRDGRGLKPDRVKAYLFLRNSDPHDPNAKAELAAVSAQLTEKDWQKIRTPFVPSDDLRDPNRLSCH